MKQIFPFSNSLFSAVAVQVLCQIFKFIVYSIKEKRIMVKYLHTAGGMPSSHSAFVTALCISIGLYNGFSSEFFAISFVFAAIIIYDAYRLRGTVQSHSRIIQKLVRLLPDGEKEDVELMVGHTVPEIAAGIITGAIFAVGIFLIFSPGPA
ncbi:MAG: divergent PAP2 family protein [Spirochaetales bacterium]|nr:divergent PAP2 family protein [Spirochaetales bacterium]